MSRLTDVIDALTRVGCAADGSSAAPFPLACAVVPPDDPVDVVSSWVGYDLPGELSELWRASGGARLFEDLEYGQWGLILLSADASASRSALEASSRASDFGTDDIVIGEFLGDQELLVFSQREGVLVALPLDGRADWFVAGSSLAAFLEDYLAAGGEKFWEQRS